MADPFSVFAATTGLIDVCWCFGSYLHDVRVGAAEIEDEIKRLSREIEALRVINETIRASYKELPNHLSSGIESSKHMERLWRNVSSNLEDCRVIVEELEALVKGIVGKEPLKDESKFMRTIDGFKKQVKKQSKAGDFNKLQTRLITYYNTIQLMLDLIIWSVKFSAG